MGMKDTLAILRNLLDTSKWPALAWAAAAGLLSWWAVGNDGALPVAVHPIAAGVALVVATLLRSGGGRERSPTKSNGGGKPHPFEERLVEEAKAHREWLHSSLQTVAWACGIVLTAGLGVALWVLGDSATAAAEGAANRMIRQDEWKPVLKDAVLEAVQRLAEPAARERVSSEVAQQVPNAVEAEFNKRIAATIEELQGLDPKALIEAYLRNVVGFGAPIGAVVAWPSSEDPPEGWEVCDGSEIEAKANEPIWQVLKSTYGKADNGKVKLPDYRGLFLRGHLGERERVVRPNDKVSLHLDPDAKTRLSPTDWSTEVGDEVGSVQFDASNLNPGNGFKTDPWHVESIHPQGGGVSGLVRRNGADITADLHNFGSIETRPKNISVSWIIRIR